MEAKHKKYFLILVLCLLTLSSVAQAGLTLKIESIDNETLQAGTSPVSSEVAAADNATAKPELRVWWEKYNESWGDMWEFEDIAWEFGPTPRFKIYYSNGTEVKEDDWIPLYEPIQMNVTIPRTVFRTGYDLGEVRISWHMYAGNLSAGMEIIYRRTYESETEVLEENTTYTESWEWWGYVYNASSGTYDTALFFVVDSDNTVLDVQTDLYVLHVVGEFNNLTPPAIYEVSVNIYDNKYNYIGTGYSSWITGGSLWRRVAVGAPYSELETYYYRLWGGAYRVSILNLDYEKVYSVGKNQSFIIRFNITGVEFSDLRNVTAIINIPSWIPVLVNVTGWYTKWETHIGGWVYNETLGTYIWDPDAVVKVKRSVYGPHLEERWIDISIHVNLTWWYWDETTGEYVPNTYLSWIDPRVYLVYDAVTNTSACYFGYEYWNETQPGQYEHFIELIPMNESELQMFELEESNVMVSGDLITVDFIGHFTEQIGEQNEVWLEYRVFDVNGWVPEDWTWSSTETYNSRRIVIERPVIFVDIIDQDGNVVNFDFFQVNPGEWFIVQIKTEGASELLEDVDGIRVTFHGNDWYWSENETRWSDLEIIVTVNFWENTTSVVAYNRTERCIYVYGEYEIWNETTGRMETVEGWHWEWYMYDQSTGEWVQGWLPWHSVETLVSETYMEILDFKNATDEYDRRIFTLNLTFTDVTPNLNYWWDVKLLNWTYGEDYTQPWGEYVIYDWTRDPIPVYSFENASGDRLYVPEPEYRSYVELNGERYLIIEKPYIVIAGEKLPIQEKLYWNGYMFEEKILFFGPWDPTTGTQTYYYILENGTEIYIYEGYQAIIYNMTLPDGSWVLTTMEYPYWNPFEEKYFILTLDREIVWLDSWISEEPVKVNSTPLEFAGYMVALNETIWLNVTTGYFLFDWEMGTYYIILENGTRLDLIMEDEEPFTYYYYIETAAGKYYVTWPRAYYVGEYEGQSILVPEWFKQNYYYTIIGEKEYELPYPGADARWLWHLENTVSEGGVVPIDPYINVNGSLYLLQNDTSGNYYIEVNGTIYYTSAPVTALYTNIMGTDVWDITQIGQRVPLGNLTTIGMFNITTYIDVKRWDYPYDPNSTIELLNGTLLTGHYAVRAKIYEVNINGTIYYSKYAWPVNWTYENETWYMGFYLIDNNGTMEYFEASVEYYLVKVIIFDLGLAGSEADTFTFNGQVYDTSVAEIEYYLQVEAVNGAIYQAAWEWQWSPIYNITYLGQNYIVTQNLEYVKMRYPIWGYPITWHLEDLDFMDIRNVWTIVVGVPRYGMWGYQRFAIDPETGALDLDGDLSTTDDQYYVLRIYHGSYEFNQTMQGLNVHIEWDPDPTTPDDELILNSWMGIATHKMRYTWSETYIWYYAENMSVVSPETMAAINATIWNEEYGEPNPGYWDIARMTINMTWEDFLRKAEEEGWYWVTEEVSWSWLWFGLQQSYWVSWEDESGNLTSTWVSLTYEYAGLFVYNDTNDDGIMNINPENIWESEATHYFIPVSVDTITFVTPGEAFGDYNETGYLILPGNESVVFGVSYLGVNGTMFPFNGRSYYSWYGEEVYGSDFRTFDERPTDVSVSELSFRVHFQGNLTAQEITNIAYIKIDQHIGDWDVDLPTGREVLENRSLSINYYVHADTAMSWAVRSPDGTEITNEDIVEASKLELDIANVKFAEFIMGDIYLWGKNLTAPRNVSSHTVPLGTFTVTYVDYNSPTSVAGWTLKSSMYFLSIGFPDWDGYSIYEDPETIVYVGRKGAEEGVPPSEEGRPGEEQPGPGEAPPSVKEIPIWMIIGLVLAIALSVAIIIRKRRAKQIKL